MENKEKKNDEIKLIVVGDSGVGKTNLINSSINIAFNPNSNSTVTGTFVSKQFIINDKKYNINLWDTAGQEQYRSITKLFFKGAEIVILVYDISKSQTFVSLDKWYSICEEQIGNQVIYGVVGNKSDLYIQEDVSEEDAKKFAEQIQAKFALVSAQNDSKRFVEFIRELIIEYIHLNHLEPRHSFTLENKSKKLNKREEKGCGC